MIRRCRSIPCFHFLFLFRNDGITEQLDQNDLRCCFGFYFSKMSFPSFVEGSFSTITRHLDKGIWKTLSSWRFHRHGSTKVSSLHQDIWLIIVCFSFSQTNLDFALNLIFVTIYLPFYLSIFCVFWSSSSTPSLFMRTNKILMRLNVVFYEGLQPQNVSFLYFTKH